MIKAAREQIHAGADLIKIMATGGVMTPGVNPEDAHYTAEEIAAGIQEGKRFHKRSASHAQGTEGILNAVRGGINSIEHGFYMTEECVDEMLERGTYLVPTLSALFNILGMAGKGIPDYVIEKAKRVGEHHKRSIQMFYEAGGKIAMGTDAGTPFNFHGENAQELEFMVQEGISPLDALKFGTINAARPDRSRRRGPDQARRGGGFHRRRRQPGSGYHHGGTQGEPSPGGQARSPPGRPGGRRRRRDVPQHRRLLAGIQGVQCYSTTI